MPDLKIEQWEIGRLIPYARNPRKNDAQVDRMTSAIREFGFKIPILAKSDGTVIDGHLRLKAAHKLGMQAVPVTTADDLTDAQVKAFRILANKSVAWAEWDNDLLKLEMEELQGLAFDLSKTGFEISEISNLLGADFPFGDESKPDQLPPPDLAGDDNRTGRFIITFSNEDQKRELASRLGIDGEKVVYSFEEIDG